MTRKEINALPDKHKQAILAQISASKVKAPKSVDKANKQPKNSKEKDFIHFALMQSGFVFIPELRFDKLRRFRFDFAIPCQNIAIEYDGLMSAKSRHTTVTGFTKDCEKFNLAALQGWRVLKYTALNYKQIVSDLEKLKAPN